VLAPPLTHQEIAALTAEQLVNKLWDKRIRNAVIRQLVGGLTSTELRAAEVSAEVRLALAGGLLHWSPKVRWWCLQLIDHVADLRCLDFVPPLLDDPVQRVRKQARHTLTCEACKHAPETAAHGKRLLGDYEARASAGWARTVSGAVRLDSFEGERAPAGER